MFYFLSYGAGDGRAAGLKKIVIFYNVLKFL
jgi:hypothetical protein